MKKLILIMFLLTTVISYSQVEHKHHVGIFLGTSIGTYAGGAADFAVGIDYEYKIPKVKPNFGIGLVAEYVLAHNPENLIGFPFYIHPYKGLKFYLMPGIYMKSTSADTLVKPIVYPKHNEQLLYNEITKESNTKFFWRLGAGYDFHYKKIILTPNLAADVISTKLYIVAGLGFGISF